MGANYYFFTNPLLLAPQVEEQAFGPVAANQAPSGHDQFLVTDMHAAANVTAPCPVFAVCRGQVRMQWDSPTKDGLTLILKPSWQPRSEFPTVAYYIYKGIDPASLFSGSSTTLDSAKQSSNPLIATIYKFAATPDHRCLGLDLTASEGFADIDPIEKLFFVESDFPAIYVNEGWRLGDFLTAAFGFEVVVARMASQATLGATRNRAHRIDVASMTVTTPASDPSVFKGRHDREAVLDYVDPSAFWGSFLPLGLHVGSWVGASLLYDKIIGPDRYWNRSKAYLDLRNEHGQSLAYYGSVDSTIETSIAGVSLSRNIYPGGWPVFSLGDADMSGSASGETIRVGVRLPHDGFSKTVAYVATGHGASKGGQRRPLTERERFVVLDPVAGEAFLPEFEIVLRLNGSPANLAPGYYRIHQFRRPQIFDDGTLATPPAGNFAPVFAQPTDYLFAVPGPTPYPRETTTCLIRTYADLIFVPWPANGMAGFVARPGVARDAANDYLFLFPVAGWPGADAIDKPDMPEFQQSDRASFLPLFLQALADWDFAIETIVTEASGASAAGLSVKLIYLRHGRAWPGRDRQLPSSLAAVVMQPSEFVDLVLDDVLPGTGFLSVGSYTARHSDGVKYFESAATMSYLAAAALGGTQPVTRTDGAFQTIYRHADS